MKLVISDTTDRQFLGHQFEGVYPMTLPDGTSFTPERQIEIAPKHFRLITSNYVIDVKEQ
jgi:hypothetical protein